MLLKALFLAILIYFVLRTATRLMTAMKTGAAQLNREPGAADHGRSWKGTTPPRSYENEDVEDAKFVDV